MGLFLYPKAIYSQSSKIDALDPGRDVAFAQVEHPVAGTRGLVDGEGLGAGQELVGGGGAAEHRDFPLLEVLMAGEGLMDMAAEDASHLAIGGERLPEGLAILEPERIDPGRA